MNWFSTHKYICLECNFVAKGFVENCPNCHSKNSMRDIGYKARPPKKRASKRKWKDFWTNWVPQYLQGVHK